MQLIPRLHQWAGTYYPGTKVAITEYNWGAEGFINGATAQADILGIFGREQLDLSTRWTTPDTGSPTYKAIRMYRNYDGKHSAFGDISVGAEGPNVDEVAPFAAVRSSDHALTVMIVTKTLLGDTPATMKLSNFVPVDGAVVQRWQLDSGNAITPLASLTLAGPSISLTLPPQSITLLVVPGASAPGAPVILPAASENGRAVITFTAPASNGGSSITRYTATCNPGSSSASGTASPVTVSGLTNGTRYSCSVAAFNAVGGGPSSAALIVTPVGAITARHHAARH